MSRVGTRANAELALTMAGGGTEGYPDWHMLDGGSMRVVLLHKPSGVVYKVDDYMWDASYGNASEYRRAKVLSRMPWEHVRIPAVSLYTFGGNKVLAMEYVEGYSGRDFKYGTAAAPDNRNGRIEFYYKGRLRDMHGMNFLIEKDSGKFVPIDMGSPRSRSVMDADRRILD